MAQDPNTRVAHNSFPHLAHLSFKPRSWLALLLLALSVRSGEAFLSSPRFEVHISRNSRRDANSHSPAHIAFSRPHEQLCKLRGNSQAEPSSRLACSQPIHTKPKRSSRHTASTPTVIARNVIGWIIAKGLLVLSMLFSLPRQHLRWLIRSTLLGLMLCGTAVTTFSAAPVSGPLTGGIGALPAMSALQTKFMLNWRLYVTIPVVAGLLNWATNKLAVNMIFYPLEFWGLRIKTWAEQPFGLVGWTGIVPVKAKPMATRMVRMVTSSLIDVREVAKRVDPERIADILSPVAEQTIEEVGSDLRLGWALQSPLVYGPALQRSQRFVSEFTRTMQENIDDILDLEGMVVRAMVNDKRVLVELFQECGSKELRFVVNSGLFLGFLLGTLQMGVWLCWDPWWSLAVGGALVGYLTNFFAIKSIFEPVEPVQLGPLRLQGLFLTRQKEVSAQFGTFLRERCLTADKIWHEILYGGKKEKFYALLEQSVQDWVDAERALQVAQSATRRPLAPTISTALQKALQAEVHRVCPYMDDVLDLETEMRTKMRSMSSAQFESVLHPIFEEDELTLILVGAVLGFVAGFLQSMAPY